jgi:hypothetical protein
VVHLHIFFSLWMAEGMEYTYLCNTDAKTVQGFHSQSIFHLTIICLSKCFHLHISFYIFSKHWTMGDNSTRFIFNTRKATTMRFWPICYEYEKYGNSYFKGYLWTKINIFISRMVWMFYLFVNYVHVVLKTRQLSHYEKYLQTRMFQR